MNHFDNLKRYPSFELYNEEQDVLLKNTVVISFKPKLVFPVTGPSIIFMDKKKPRSLIKDNVLIPFYDNHCFFITFICKGFV